MFCLIMAVFAMDLNKEFSILSVSSPVIGEKRGMTTISFSF